MWSAYAPPAHGVAIVTNFSDVVDALAAASDRIFATKVQYVDFVNDPVDNHLSFPMHKRLSFSYERELRLIYLDPALQHSRTRLTVYATSWPRQCFTVLVGQSEPTKINWKIIEDDVAKIRYPAGHCVRADIGALIEGSARLSDS